jgi:hypothetical protein
MKIKSPIIVVAASIMLAIALSGNSMAAIEVRKAIPVLASKPTMMAQSTTAVKAAPTAMPSATPTASPTDEEKAAAGAAAVMLFFAGAFLFIALWLWFLPGIIASKRKHPNAGSIWLITLFLGWSLFGWFGALIWACSAKE